MELFKVFLLECGPHPHIAFSYFFWWCHIGSNVSRILCGMMVLLRWPVAFVGSSVPNYSSACMHEYVFVRLRFFLMTRCRLRRSIPSWYVALTNCIRTLEACSLMTRQFEWPIDCVVREDLELGSQNHYSQSLFSYFSMRLAAGVTICLQACNYFYVASGGMPLLFWLPLYGGMVIMVNIISFQATSLCAFLKINVDTQTKCSSFFFDKVSIQLSIFFLGKAKGQNFKSQN